MSFDDFWKLYPRKEARGTARRAYEKVIKKVLHEDIMSGMGRYLERIDSEKRERKFIKLPATWLNGECWDDEYQPSLKQRLNEIPEQVSDSRRAHLVSRIADAKKKEERFQVSFASYYEPLQAELDSLDR